MKRADGTHIVPLYTERLSGTGKLEEVPDWRKPSDRLPRHLWRGVPARFIKAKDYDKWLAQEAAKRRTP